MSKNPTDEALPTVPRSVIWFSVRLFQPGLCLDPRGVPGIEFHIFDQGLR
ncbi:hypothetical protein D779_3698 [Imhoffiella purpurea]|uniref:Uncharacterized protein n=1 Tax=Imhoffiella purpurea TaxID=1249627 RepID=W9VSY4_9GAMM|nr:hypothetical protein D779_3698 [Imhoffiella purpurea]